jgi:hypothetical protein
MWDYNGTRPDLVPALKVTMTPQGGDDDGPIDQYFTAGNAKDWDPSQDGSRLVPIGTAEKLNDKSNVAILITSIIAAGFPTDQMEDDCSIFDGMDCHVIRVKAPKRSGLNRPPPTEGKEEREQTNLVVDEIYELPGEGADSGKGAKGKGSSKTEASGDSDLTVQAETILMDILGEKDPVTKKQITTAAFKPIKDDPNRQALMGLLIDDDFLGAEERPWTFNEKKGSVSLG